MKDAIGLLDGPGLTDPGESVVAGDPGGPVGAGGDVPDAAHVVAGTVVGDAPDAGAHALRLGTREALIGSLCAGGHRSCQSNEQEGYSNTAPTHGWCSTIGLARSGSRM